MSSGRRNISIFSSAQISRSFDFHHIINNWKLCWMSKMYIYSTHTRQINRDKSVQWTNKAELSARILALLCVEKREKTVRPRGKWWIKENRRMKIKIFQSQSFSECWNEIRNRWDENDFLLPLRFSTNHFFFFWGRAAHRAAVMNSLCDDDDN